jgi:hypothetical protein
MTLRKKIWLCSKSVILIFRMNIILVCVCQSHLYLTILGASVRGIVDVSCPWLIEKPKHRLRIAQAVSFQLVCKMKQGSNICVSEECFSLRV